MEPIHIIMLHWVYLSAQFLFWSTRFLGYYSRPCFWLIFGKRALLAALWLYAMVIFAHFRLPFGARSQLAFSFLYFLSSYSFSYYHLIQENIRDHRDEMGAKWDFKRKKREKSRRLKRKSLYSPFLKREKGKKVSKKWTSY